jgi:hypothetical protein
MRAIGLLCLSATLVLTGCGGSDDGGDDGPSSGGSRTVVVNEFEFDETGVSMLLSHLTTPPSSTGALIFENGPATPPVGEGSGEWRTGSDGNSGVELRFEVLDGTRLEDVTRLSFWTYTESGTGDQTVNLSMRIDWDNDGIEDDRIYFEPEYQSGYTMNVPDQGVTVIGAWQFWDALAGGWWSNNDQANFGPGSDVGLLEDYIAAHPDATVITHTDGSGGTRLTAGYGAPNWDSFVGNADALEVGILGDVTTFDLDP